MTLIKRATQLFKADAHAVLDGIEEPHSLLKQAVREMQDIIDQDQHRVKVLQSQELQLQQQLKEQDKELQKLENDIELCFESDNEGLARNTVKRKLLALKMRQSLLQKQQSVENQLQELRKALEDRQSRLESMSQKLLAYSQESDPNGEPTYSEHLVSADEVEIAYLQELKKRSRS